MLRVHLVHRLRRLASDNRGGGAGSARRGRDYHDLRRWRAAHRQHDGGGQSSQTDYSREQPREKASQIRFQGDDGGAPISRARPTGDRLTSPWRLADGHRLRKDGPFIRQDSGNDAGAIAWVVAQDRHAPLNGEICHQPESEYVSYVGRMGH
jgi:hypothetical protein